MKSPFQNISLPVNGSATLLISFMLGMALSASANLVVAPASLAASEGNSEYAFSDAGAFTFQQIYGTSAFAGLSIGDQITGIQLRLNGGYPSLPTSAVSIAQFNVFLGPSNFRPGSLSSSVTSNQGPGTVLARSGALAIPANSFPGGSTPNAFGLLISFSTPYIYTGGDLLLTLSYTSAGGDLDFDAGFGLADVEGRSGAGYNNSTLDNDFRNYALVAQFTTIAVPEPRIDLLVFVGAIALLVAARRSKAKAFII
jgi:hypothetical protein